MYKWFVVLALRPQRDAISCMQISCTHEFPVRWTTWLCIVVSCTLCLMIHSLVFFFGVFATFVFQFCPYKQDVFFLHPRIVCYPLNRGGAKMYCVKVFDSFGFAKVWKFPAPPCKSLSQRRDNNVTGTAIVAGSASFGLLPVGGVC